MMRILYYLGLAVILLISNSCSLLDNPNKTKSLKFEKNKIKQEFSSYSYCPDFLIPIDTNTLKNKKNQKLIRLYNIKLKCKLESNKTDDSKNKVIITQTIYYQVLKNNFRLDNVNPLAYVALVDKDQDKVKFKILSKVNSAPYIKVKKKIFFKNTNKFKINLYENNEELVFYYGFQN